MFLSGFSQVLEINPCNRKIICDTCELINMLGDILNAGGNIEDKYDYWFIESFFKNPLIL